MLFETIALALTGLAVPIQALGFTIPDGQPDGVYIVTYLEDGIANHTKIADPFVKGIRRRAPGTQGLEIANDPPITISCGAGGEFNHGDCDSAVEDLKRQCGSGTFVSSHHNFYSIRNQVVAFFCNFGGDNRCDSGSVGHFASLITNQCGWYKPGWGTINDWALSYGYDYSNTRFCGTGP